MANLKNITDLPVVESAEGLNLIVNDNGSAKQISADLVGGAASWNDLTDKPFYEEGNVIDICVDEEFTLMYEEPSGNVFDPKTKYALTDGSVCNFIINGVTYTDIVIADGTYLGEYIVRLYNGKLSSIYAPVGTTSLTVSLAVKNTTVKQIDEKFIPDSVKVLMFEIGEGEYSQTGDNSYKITKNYDILYEALLSGRFAYINMQGCFYSPISVYVQSNYGLRVIIGHLPNNSAGFPDSELLFTNGSYHNTI